MLETENFAEEAKPEFQFVSRMNFNLSVENSKIP